MKFSRSGNHFEPHILKEQWTSTEKKTITRTKTIILWQSNIPPNNPPRCTRVRICILTNMNTWPERLFATWRNPIMQADKCDKIAIWNVCQKHCFSSFWIPNFLPRTMFTLYLAKVYPVQEYNLQWYQCCSYTFLTFFKPISIDLYCEKLHLSHRRSFKKKNECSRFAIQVYCHSPLQELLHCLRTNMHHA